MMNISFPQPHIEIKAFPDVSVEHRRLLFSALAAREQGSQPVSQFHVGAAINVVGANKPCYTGANRESVNFNGTTHAEQMAVDRALFDREDTKQYDTIHITALAVVGAMRDISFDDILQGAVQNIDDMPEQTLLDSFVTPCGHCRQIYAPYIDKKSIGLFLNPQGRVAKINLSSLLPWGFSSYKE